MNKHLPKRPKTSERHTPHYDAWLEELRARLEHRGAKTDLATYIARHARVSAQGLKSKLPLILSRQTLAHGEFVCAANAWMRAAGTVE